MANGGGHWGRRLALALGCLGVVTVAGIAGLAIAIWFAGSATNAGPVSLAKVDASYHLEFREGGLRDRNATSDGALLLKAILETETVPSTNGFAVLSQQLWYNAILDGHELEIWMEPAEGYDSYAIYQTDGTIFLRDEAGGSHRVLIASFTAEQLEDRLSTYASER
jgi:hypothetical protein